ncbi:TetR family transcriptional regulator C-terminal domain-containing protein [Catelliglobosispora koreensis]|uniref:TetR family transcriptional regulator C-terminal domain-containing protein n=1 Tax=Catelliglobosispora koreensis TaxID=129052 RepID=UPI00039D7D86|nr:TetR family transcriptional regulator C-terminal domain-containing protein [Catelliglobosispora koreensis]
MLGILPLTPQAAASNRIWVSSWDAALADAELSHQHGLRYAHSRERLRQHIQAAQRLGELPPSNPDSAAASVQSFALGLIVQALFAPAAFPPETQISLLDTHLAQLTTRPPAQAGTMAG